MFLKILLPAFLVGILGYFLAKGLEKADLPFTIPVRPAVCGFLAGMIPVIIFFVRLGVTARPEERPGLLALLPIYLAGGAFFMILHLNGSAMTQWARDDTNRQVQGSNRSSRRSIRGPSKMRCRITIAMPTKRHRVPIRGACWWSMTFCRTAG